MWPGFDPEIQQELAYLRRMVSLRRQTPTREWPLLFMEEQRQILVVREWPDGSVTAYTMSNDQDLSGKSGRS
jgi:hypothetical protein